MLGDTLNPARPRRVALRAVLRTLIHAAFAALSRVHVEGRENIPADGPLLVVANHFNYADPVAMIHLIPGPIEFIAGTARPTAPNWLVSRLPDLWGTLNVHRGGISRDALVAAKAYLSAGGVLGVFPEGGAWAQVLRPPLPGVAYLAAESGARLLPIGLDGMETIFATLKRGRRTTLTMRIGRTFGPYSAPGRGRRRREQLTAIGDDIMQHIAALIPAERHGVYSTDPHLRAAAQAVATIPWSD